jgi:hypothetical protein
LEVEEERRRRRDRELAAARDAEIRDLIQRTRYLTTEVEEFVESMGNTVPSSTVRHARKPRACTTSPASVSRKSSCSGE